MTAEVLTTDNTSGQGQEQGSAALVAVRQYLETPDLDSKAEILNTRVVSVVGSEAIPSSVSLMVELAAAERFGIEQYRPDVVRGLDSTNLIAVANRLAKGDVEDNPRVLTIESIHKAAGTSTFTDRRHHFEDEVISELAERVLESVKSDTVELRQLIHTIDGMATFGLIRSLKDRPDLLHLLRDMSGMFQNEDLREVIKVAWDELNEADFDEEADETDED